MRSHPVFDQSFGKKEEYLKRHLSILISLALAFVFVTAVWQISERNLTDLGANTIRKVLGTSFQEAVVWDDNGLPLRYLPGAGKVYDVRVIAHTASRGYATRVDPQRLQWFLKGTDWIMAQVDSSGTIYQPYNYPAMGAKSPWLSASAQAAATLAVLQRAGFERDLKLLALSLKMLDQFKPELNKFVRSESDSMLMFVDHPSQSYSLLGQISTLSDLQQIDKLISNPLTKEMVDKGMHSLVAKLPSLEKHGFLRDDNLRLSRVGEHYQLTQMLQELSTAYPDPELARKVKGYTRKHHSFILAQLVSNFCMPRILGFVASWLLFAYIIWLFIRRPERNFTKDEG